MYISEKRYELIERLKKLKMKIIVTIIIISILISGCSSKDSKDQDSNSNDDSPEVKYLTHIWLCNDFRNLIINMTLKIDGKEEITSRKP